MLASLATLQAAAAACALVWAWPLFVDPLVLGNGISRRAQALRVAEGVSELRALPRGTGDLLEILFWNHSNGVIVVIASAAVLAFSSLITWIILANPPKSRFASAFGTTSAHLGGTPEHLASERRSGHGL
ncbi:MAG: hypothetical protein KDI71_17260 [Xanthomonadales bacterium]|nr:hypothetical protein [Xanthomonadales bacterium]